MGFSWISFLCKIDFVSGGTRVSALRWSWQSARGKIFASQACNPDVGLENLKWFPMSTSLTSRKWDCSSDSASIETAMPFQLVRMQPAAITYKLNCPPCLICSHVKWRRQHWFGVRRVSRSECAYHRWDRRISSVNITFCFLSLPCSMGRASSSTKLTLGGCIHR